MRRKLIVIYSLAIVLVFGICSLGCSGGSSRKSSSSGSTTSPTTSASAPTTPGGVVPITTATTPHFDPARTLTVFVNGFDPNGSASTGNYGVDRISGIARRAANRTGLPLGDANPSATDQMTEVAYYGTNPPAYYSTQDLLDVDLAQKGTVRYATIVAKFVRHVLDRSSADHVNLIGASFGGLITRYVIEKDLEGLASGGRIVRWLTVEGTAGGVWAADRITAYPLLTPILSALFPSQVIDPVELSSMSYDFVRQSFNTPDPKRSDSLFFSNIIVGFTVSGDFDAFNQVLRHASGAPNDGVLLVEDQYLHDMLARPNPALVHTSTNHFGAARDEGLSVNVANFLRSRRRARITLVDATVRSFPEWIWHGAGEVVFCTDVVSPSAQQEWGVTDSISATNDVLGTAPLTPFVAGSTELLDRVVFDWFLAPTETELEFTLSAQEIDNNAFYGVYEQVPNSQFMDGKTLRFPVDTLGISTYVVDTPSFSATVEVRVFDE